MKGNAMFRSRKKIISSIVRRERANGGHTYEAYLGVDPEKGTPVRLYRTSKTELVDAVNEFCNGLEEGGELQASLEHHQLVDAKMAFNMLREKECPLSLTECVRRVLEDLPACMKGIGKTCGEVYDEYVAKFGDQSSQHVKTVRVRVGRLVSSYGREKPVQALDAAYIRYWIEEGREKDYGGAEGCNDRSWNNYVGYIAAWLNWCVRKGYLARNPMERDPDLRKVHIPWKEPKFIHADELRKVMDGLSEAGDHSMLAFAVMSFMCGTRTSEIVRLADAESRNRLDIAERTCRIVDVKGLTKGIKPRCFTIPDQAVKWMESFPFMDGLHGVNPHTVDRMREFAHGIGVELPKNCGRKSFITMHRAMWNDPNRLGAIVGNSEEVRDTTYIGLASKAEADAYFSVLPS